MTDVPCHTWILPTLLKHAGISFLHIGCNDASHAVQVPPLFWWEGPDGSRVLTEYSGHYGTSLFPPDNWPYRTWLAVIMTGDNEGPPSPSQVDSIRKQVAQQLPGVKLKFGKLEHFCDAIAAERNAKIPVIRADMPDTWIHGIESMPVETKTAWNSRPLETAAGVLDTQLRSHGVGVPALAPELAEAYEKSLLYSEHTFGLYGLAPGGFWYGDEWKKQRAAGRYKRFEAVFDAKRDYIRDAARVITKALNERLALLAQNVDIAGPREVVFNPLPWKRDGIVEVNGKSMWVENVPPCGYKTIGVTQSKTTTLKNDATTIASPFFRLTVDLVRGGLASLTDVKTGRELIAPQAGTGQYLHERFCVTNVQEFCHSYFKVPMGWAVNDFGKPRLPGLDKLRYGTIPLTHWTASAVENAVGKSITLRCADAAPLAKSVSLKYTLYNDQPYLDIQWNIEDKTPDPAPEGGWLAFSFAINQPRFKLTRLGSIIDPAKDIIAGGNREIICLNSGMTVTGADGYGVGLCPMDSPLVSLSAPGLWKYSDTYVPTKSNVFINLYNNMWNTNFPLWQDGSWSSRVRLWVVRSRGMEQDVITPSWEARVPLLVAHGDGAAGHLPSENYGLELSRRGVLVTNFGPDPYSNKTLLRIWEQAGDSCKLTVTIPGMFKMARPVNLRGESIGDPQSLVSGKLHCDLPAFAPASFVLE
jgi:hypothetical protein